MTNVNYLNGIFKVLNLKSTHFLRKFHNRLTIDQTFASLRVIFNAPFHLESILQFQMLIALKVKLVVVVSNELYVQEEILQIIENLKIKTISFEEIDSYECDLAIDYGGKLYGKIKPKYGVIETSYQGLKKYNNSDVNYPVINASDLQIRALEGIYEISEQFIKNLKLLTKTSLDNKHFVIIGYGKIGAGIVKSLSAITNRITVVDHDETKIKAAQDSGLKAYFISDPSLMNQINDCFCVVTASGQKEVMTQYFHESDFQNQYLVNMGFEDEWGANFKSLRILQSKRPINHSALTIPKLIYSDAIFYQECMIMEYLVTHNLENGIIKYPCDLEIATVTEWITSNYKPKLENNYLENIINNIPACIYWKDADLTIQGGNKQFAKSIGFEDISQLIGRSSLELQSNASYSELLQNTDAEVLLGKSITNVEKTQIITNGSQQTKLFNKVPLRNNDGDIVGILGIYSDITERKLQEEKVKQALTEKTNILNNMSHEVRTPIHGICGASELLDDKWDDLTDEERRTQIHSLAQNGQRLRKFIDNLLDLSKFSAGRMIFEPRKVDLIELISEVIDQYLALYLTGKTVNVIFDYAEIQQATIYADPLRINQLLLNIFSNAIKYGNYNNVTVKLRAESNSINPMWHVSIVDEGIGIPSDQIEYIFEAFTQSNRTKNTLKGTGLGLALAKEITVAHHGEIWAENNKIKGATFHFILPAVLPDKLGPKPKHIAKNEPDFTSIDKKITILLVDDEKFCHTLIKLNFNHIKNCEIISAYNAAEALEYIEDRYQDINVILIDIMLPDIKGVDLFHKIKTASQLKDKPIAIIFQSGIPEKVEKFKTTYSNDVIASITKPYTKNEILTAVFNAVTQILNPTIS